MPDQFPYDVFLSHSAKDKAVVRPLAERLRQDGLKVWFDEWVLKPGDSIPAKIEEGLEHSRVLVLCMSAHAFGSDWAQLEAGTFRFRDPLNQERRFIPLRLDDAPIKGSLAQFLYINWLPADRKKQYAKLFEACRPTTKPCEEAQPKEQSAPDLTPAVKGRILFAHNDGIYALAVSPDGRWVLADTVKSRLKKIDLTEGGLGELKNIGGGSEREAKSAMLIRSLAISPDGKMAATCSSAPWVQLWDVAEMRPFRRLIGHRRPACSVALFSSGEKVVSGSYDGSVRIWKTSSGRRGAKSIYGHSRAVKALALTPDDQTLVSGSEDTDIHVWDIASGDHKGSLLGHAEGVTSLAITPDGRTLVSGSHDKTIRVWDIEKGKCTRILEGHTARVFSVAITPDGKRAVSGSFDRTIRVWDLETGMCLSVLRGHNNSIRSVAITPDGRHAVSGSIDGTVRLWQMPPSASRPAGQAILQYTNAKVLLVGESGVGKTGLSNYLALHKKVEDDKPLPSTDGAWATHWPLKHDKKKAGVEREIWLWDFAGQVDYRLVHQLFMDDTAAAVLVFNPQNENPFEGLGHWDRDLQKAARKPFVKLLAAARIDRGGLVVSAASMKKFMGERGFLGALHETSAKTGKGCDALREAIVQAIDWKGIPETTSPALYHRMKQEILSLRDSGFVLIRLAELKQRMEMTLRAENFEPAELETVVSLLAGPGMIQRLDFGGFILLRPEVLSRYAAAVVRKVRKHPQELGCIREDELLAGDLDYQDFKRLPREDEAVVLRTLLETFISRAWCLRQPRDGSALLTSPQIKNPRWADYWQQQAYAVMLVIRTSDGEIRWMDVSAYLKRESADGKTVRQIVFAGERFDAVSVQNWRKRVLVPG